MLITRVQEHQVALQKKDLHGVMVEVIHEVLSFWHSWMELKVRMLQHREITCESAQQGWCCLLVITTSIMSTSTSELNLAMHGNLVFSSPSFCQQVVNVCQELITAVFLHSVSWRSIKLHGGEIHEILICKWWQILFQSSQILFWKTYNINRKTRKIRREYFSC